MVNLGSPSTANLFSIFLEPPRSVSIRLSTRVVLSRSIPWLLSTKCVFLAVASVQVRLFNTYTSFCSDKLDEKRDEFKDSRLFLQALVPLLMLLNHPKDRLWLSLG